MKDFEKQYKTLANSRRLQIIKHLSKHSSSTVSDIAREIRLGIKSTSKHLRILSTVDFLDKEQKSLNVYYFLPKTKPKILEDFLKLL